MRSRCQLCVGKTGMWLFAFRQVPRQYKANQIGCPDPSQPGGESTPFPGTDTSEKERVPRSMAKSIAKVSKADWAQLLLKHYSLSEK